MSAIALLSGAKRTSNAKLAGRSENSVPRWAKLAGAGLTGKQRVYVKMKRGRLMPGGLSMCWHFRESPAPHSFPKATGRFEAHC